MKEKIQEAFFRRYGAEAPFVSRAPGRLEILGNHTDYNQGTTLSTAVDRYIWFAASPVEGTLCTVWDEGVQEERQFDLRHLENPQAGDWCNYIKGVVAAMQKRGIAVPAFRAVMQGNVPMSAGMSSSAAFEMAVVTVLDRLCNANLDWLAMAKLGQASENDYIGARTGLLDQFSSLRGKEGSLVYSDFRTLDTATVPMPAGTAFVVVNSMVKHVLTGEYNERRKSCEDAVACLARRKPEIRSLRDASFHDLIVARKDLEDRDFACAAHVIGEICRVADGVRALENNDLTAFGRLLFQSHESSRCLFQNSCQELDTLIELAHGLPGVLGARLSGGGFGGISVHLVREEQAEEYAKAIAAAYEARTGIRPPTFLCKAAEGACLL